ncbi:Rib/alpha-like domain-containing protein [Arcanobacterium phocae]|uniref:Rib/alpha-like domain-containing protein n=1 Tax=Arcanobacterium phocae TaxID=131112 RepID=UPI001C0EAF99|nr:Rib/alpha-like domain-containing protein [Arcanobacterium phocae]
MLPRFTLWRFATSLTLLAVGTVAAPAQLAQAEEATEASALADHYTFDFNWEHKNHGTYAPEMTGQEEKILAQFHLTGIDPATNERKLFHPATVITTKIGESQTYEIPTASFEWKGVTYTDIRLDAGHNCTDLFFGYPLGNGEYSSRIIGSGQSCPAGIANGPDPAAGTDHIRIALSQQANTDFRFTIADDSTILTEHKDMLKANIGLNITKNGVTTVHTNKNGKPISYPFTFVEKAFQPATGIDGLQLWESPFNRAINGNRLPMFSKYTGRYSTYTLTADFADSADTTATQLNEFYSLAVSGDDVAGWTVTLHSSPLQANYADTSALPGADVVFAAPTVDVVGTADVEHFNVPEKMTFARGENTPTWVNVNPDGTLSGTLPKDAKPGTTIAVPVTVTLPNGDMTDVTINVSVNQPLIDITPIGELTVTGEAVFIDGQDDAVQLAIATDDENAAVSASGLPDGLTFDPQTGMVSGTPVLTDWSDNETERVIPVTFTAHNSDGSSFSSTFDITIIRDSDGDGVVDTLDKCPATPDGATVDETGCVPSTPQPTDPKPTDPKPSVPKPSAPAMVLAQTGASTAGLLGLTILALSAGGIMLSARRKNS